MAYKKSTAGTGRSSNRSTTRRSSSKATRKSSAGTRTPGRPSGRPGRKRKGSRELSLGGTILFLAIFAIFAIIKYTDIDERIIAKVTGKPFKSSGQVEEPTTKAEYTENLEVHYIYVGQGDSTLIRCGSAAMLIDAGENNQGEVVTKYLKEQGVEKLDIVVGTHSHSDHVGGLDVVIDNFDCEKIILSEYTQDTKTYNDLLASIEKKNYKITRPVVNNTYSLGDATVTILGPVSYDYGDNPNNYSILVRVDYGNNRFLFTGDAEEDVEEDVLEANLDISADVYKVAHHGSTTSNTYDFLMKVNPTYGIVSCGIDNDYGHPHDEVVERLESMGVEIKRTDELGDIVVYSDGNKIWFDK